MNDETTAPSALSGAERIKSYLKTLPDLPGVYRMVGRKGEVLYVGKAKNLKGRVAAYTKPQAQSYRIARMISETHEMIFVTTATESEALLLEANLIKRLKPRYNVLFRDDKSFPNILLREDHDYAQLLKHRGAKSRKGIYFGPFASASAVNSTLNTLQRAFLLRTCSDSVFAARTRPCLLYQIKRCSGPCVGRITTEDYVALVSQTKEFLAGRSRSVQERLARQMKTAADAMNYEKAAQLRDRIQAMSQVQARQGVNPTSFSEADVFAAFQRGGQTCVQVFFFRAGQNWGNRPFFPRHTADIPLKDVLAAFISQLYDNRPPARLILLSEDIPERALLAKALSLKAGHRVEIAVPARGEKHNIARMALTNAEAQLARLQAENATQKGLLEGVAKSFDLDTPPERIEVYDNSHIQGAMAVGAMIVAGPEGFQKAEYRKFNVKSETLSPGDDTAMIHEVLMRRFARLMKESTAEDGTVPGKWTKWPDLVLIDGGNAQVEAAHTALEDVGLEEIVVVGIAKSVARESGREHFFIRGQEPFRLDAKDPVLYYLQRLRDEAHRFAVGSHRKQRLKAIGANPLDAIEGVGATRKRALLSHFGSTKAVTEAGIPDLEAVEGISRALAKRIYDIFHSS